MNKRAPDRWQVLAGLLVLLYVAAMIFMFQTNLDTVREPPLLLPILNTLFAALIPIGVSIIAARAYLSSGLTNLLFKGCGMLAFGCGACREGQQWRFSVTGNGVGIVAQYQDRIFGMFQRLHRRREFPGTGMGLAICKCIVERHDGQIGVEPAPGGGSIFWFTLPAEKTT